jgi:acyl-CoA thioesterase FadM
MNLWLRLVWLRIRLRRRRPVGIWDTVRTPFRVAPSDLDVLRHMNNGKYLSLLDLGRVDLMVRCGFWATLRRKGWYPVVSAQTITYRRSLEPWQRFELVTRILGIDERAGYLEQTFVVGDVVHARAIVQARFLKRSGGTVPQSELIAAVGGVPADRQLPEWITAWADATRISSVSRSE